MSKLEAFKMCMAEAGFPQPNAYELETEPDNFYTPDADHSDENLVRAIWRACRLTGDDLLLRWCFEHYWDRISNHVGEGLGPACPCYGD